MNLAVLTLWGNPLAALPHARAFVVYTLPTVSILDGEEVTALERADARVRFDRAELDRLRDALRAAQRAPRTRDTGESGIVTAATIAPAVQANGDPIPTHTSATVTDGEYSQLEAAHRASADELARTLDEVFDLRQQLAFERLDRAAAPDMERGNDNGDGDHTDYATAPPLAAFDEEHHARLRYALADVRRQLRELEMEDDLVRTATTTGPVALSNGCLHVDSPSASVLDDSARAAHLGHLMQQEADLQADLADAMADEAAAAERGQRARDTLAAALAALAEARDADTVRVAQDAVARARVESNAAQDAETIAAEAAGKTRQALAHVAAQLAAAEEAMLGGEGEGEEEDQGGAMDYALDSMKQVSADTQRAAARSEDAAAARERAAALTRLHEREAALLAELAAVEGSAATAGASAGSSFVRLRFESPPPATASPMNSSASTIPLKTGTSATPLYTGTGITPFKTGSSSAPLNTSSLSFETGRGATSAPSRVSSRRTAAQRPLSAQSSAEVDRLRAQLAQARLQLTRAPSEAIEAGQSQVRAAQAECEAAEAREAALRKALCETRSTLRAALHEGSSESRHPTGSGDTGQDSLASLPQLAGRVAVVLQQLREGNARLVQHVESQQRAADADAYGWTAELAAVTSSRDALQEDLDVAQDELDQLHARLRAHALETAAAESRADSTQRRPVRADASTQADSGRMVVSPRHDTADLSSLTSELEELRVRVEVLQHANAMLREELALPMDDASAANDSAVLRAETREAVAARQVAETAANAARQELRDAQAAALRAARVAAAEQGRLRDAAVAAEERAATLAEALATAEQRAASLAAAAALPSQCTVGTQTVSAQPWRSAAGPQRRHQRYTLLWCRHRQYITMCFQRRQHRKRKRLCDHLLPVRPLWTRHHHR